jgi:RHS repeat-associated protein
MGSGKTAGGPERDERYWWDALGNRVKSQQSGEVVATKIDYEMGSSQVRSSEPEPGTLNTGQPYTYASYDRAGSQTWFTRYSAKMEGGGLTGGDRIITATQLHVTRSYYDAENQLRASDGQACFSEGTVGSPPCTGPTQLNNNTAGAFEWYRYDALGRRVLVRTRRDHTCGWECSSEITRYVWDGDQILLEIQAPGGDVNVHELENASDRVVYTHGPGIDRPLDVIRSGFWSLPSHWGGPVLILPVANWRGTFIGGTDARGRQLPCRNVYDCDVPFPGTLYTTFYESNGETSRLNWFGSLIAQKQDANGLFYMRNRYYNPHTGTFTQEDPIGLAGGLNLYGYANGDPINFSDPFGLSADTLEAVLVTHRSTEVPTTTYGTLCVDSSVRDNVQQVYDLAVSKGIPVDFNNAYRDRVTGGTGGRPGAGGSSQHLAGFAFDINSSSLTAAQNAQFTRIAGMYGFTPVSGDPGHYQVTGGGAKRYGSHQAAIAEARRSYAAGECVDENVEAVRGR